MPLKFRCYRCNQLLGASRHKVGTVISCPKCGSALVVPTPDEDAAPVARSAKPALEALRAAGSHDTGALFDIRPEDIRVEPGIELLAPSEEEEQENVVAEAEAPPSEIALPIEEAPAPESVEAPGEAAPPIKVAPAQGVRDHEPYGRIRARDVVLPRTVVLAWSLFVLAGLAFAFGAGLLAGHYIWRVHEPVSRLNIEPNLR